jgi:hypothetical protein
VIIKDTIIHTNHRLTEAALNIHSLIYLGIFSS